MNNITKNLFYNFVLPLCTFFLFGGFIAHAQSSPIYPLSDGLSGIFASTAALAGFVVACVAYIKGHIWTSIQGWQTLTLNFVISMAIAIVGFYTHLLQVNTVQEAMGFGVAAFITSAGFVKLAFSFKSNSGSGQ